MPARRSATSSSSPSSSSSSAVLSSWCCCAPTALVVGNEPVAPCSGLPPTSPDAGGANAAAAAALLQQCAGPPSAPPASCQSEDTALQAAVGPSAPGACHLQEEEDKEEEAEEDPEWTVADKVTALAAIARCTHLQRLELQSWLLVPLYVEEEEVPRDLKHALTECISELRNLRELHMNVVTGEPPFSVSFCAADSLIQRVEYS